MRIWTRIMILVSMLGAGHLLLGADPIGMTVYLDDPGAYAAKDTSSIVVDVTNLSGSAIRTLDLASFELRHIGDKGELQLVSPPDAAPQTKPTDSEPGLSLLVVEIKSSSIPGKGGEPYAPMIWSRGIGHIQIGPREHHLYQVNLSRWVFHPGTYTISASLRRKDEVVAQSAERTMRIPAP